MRGTGKDTSDFEEWVIKTEEETKRALYDSGIFGEVRQTTSNHHVAGEDLTTNTARETLTDTLAWFVDSPETDKTLTQVVGVAMEQARPTLCPDDVSAELILSVGADDLCGVLKAIVPEANHGQWPRAQSTTGHEGGDRHSQVRNRRCGVEWCGCSNFRSLRRSNDRAAVSCTWGSVHPEEPRATKGAPKLLAPRKTRHATTVTSKSTSPGCALLNRTSIW